MRLVRNGPSKHERRHQGKHLGGEAGFRRCVVGVAEAPLLVLLHPSAHKTCAVRSNSISKKQLSGNNRKHPKPFYGWRRVWLRKDFLMLKTWFITGSSSGFGRALTETLLARGDRVAATLRKVTALDDLKAEYGDRIWLAQLDVTDTEGVRLVVERAFDDIGRIDVVVNNAGYGLFGAAEEVSCDQIRRQIDTNLIGSIQVIRAALPLLRAQGGGRILQLSSAGGQITFPNFSLYHATKWAIEGFIEAVAQEVAPFNIEFTIVEPGAAKTNFGVSLVSAPAMTVYESTPAGEFRRSIAAAAFRVPGDPIKMVQAMIDSVDRKPAPARLALGSDTYALVREALVQRIAALDAQREIALSTDVAA
jgi:NAD(P)-dependent dehydrogenase (short-subunit alcohol dehydrogenase family)